MIYFGDADILPKIAQLGVLPDLPLLLGEDALEIRYLPSVKYRLLKSSKLLSNEKHRADLELFCNTYQPLIDSQSANSRLTYLLGIGMDAGEAQLFADAEVVSGTVVTGDKRAIKLYSRIVPDSERGGLQVICFEQLLLRVHQVFGYTRLLEGACYSLDEQQADGVLKLAFSKGRDTEEGDALEAIQSYLQGLSLNAPRLLRQFIS